MKILLLGATGRTGRLILDALLNDQYSVRILVRQKSRVNCRSDNLEIITGDTTQVADLMEAATGCQAIISALNISRTSDFPWSKLRTPVTFVSDTMSAILRTAGPLSIDRIIVCSAWGVHETRMDIPGWFRWLIDHSNIGPAYSDHENQESILVNSGLNYTIVRPVALIDLHMKIPTIVTIGNQPRPNMIISRKAVARFIVDQISDERYHKHIVTISQKLAL
nr:NAD(P)-binding oxidoreductase [uncultured Dyadobacter sp.]